MQKDYLIPNLLTQPFWRLQTAPQRVSRSLIITCFSQMQLARGKLVVNICLRRGRRAVFMSGMNYGRGVNCNWQVKWLPDDWNQDVSFIWKKEHYVNQKYCKPFSPLAHSKFKWQEPSHASVRFFKKRKTLLPKFSIITTLKPILDILQKLLHNFTRWNQAFI